MKKIGILGGGQLGMLLSQSVSRLGGEAIIFDPDPQAPACRTVKQSVNAPWHDDKALTSFFDKCDLVTYEFENVPSGAIAKFENDRLIIPNLSVLKITQNRAHEKTFLKDNQLPHVNFAVVDSANELCEKAADLHFPLVCKSAVGGYDGKFQQFIATKEELSKLAQEWQHNNENAFPVTLEEAVDLHLELSCITARSRQGEEITFPVLENVHVNHILDTTLLPARIPEHLEKALLDVAVKAARKFNAAGLLCTEFFVSKKEKSRSGGLNCGEFTIYINEFAPRPHNSGHVTMSACTLSQFDALARILLDVPLSKPRLLAPGYYCMGNLLGDIWLEQGRENHSDLYLRSLAKHVDVVDITIYGKSSARKKRKMGHFVTYALDADEAIAQAKLFRHSLIPSAI